MGPVQMSN